MSRKLLINNQWVDGSGTGKIACINPATEEVFAELPEATADDVSRAVNAARKTFDQDWKFSSGAERGAILRKLASGIKENREELAKYETMDNGKPLAEALYDVDTAAQIYEMYAGMAEDLDKQGEEEVALPVEFLKTTVAYRPIGVIAMITPWNYPIEQFTWKVAPAIAAGCTCVVKPSEYTSLTALMLGELAIEAGLPAGVLNIVLGTGPAVGEPLVAHPDVDKISFTGSTKTGRRIMEIAAQDLKRVSLELGGKSPVIVFDDVDIDKAAEWVAFGAFVNQGQVCTSTSRLLVQNKCADALLEKVKAYAETIKVGDGLSEGVQMGPLVNQAQFDKVSDYIDAGLTGGATLFAGGKRPAGLNSGYFVAPTIFTDVHPAMRIWKEEIFGPVLSVMRFETEEEAVELANASEYGLAGAVLSGDNDRVERVADKLDAGITWLNCNQLVVIQAPWGGVKKSGMGRELGRWGLQSYLEPKQKTRWLLDAGIGWYGAAGGQS
ncbi:aldehyde dehydrogenase family protein [Methyloligella sp. 2.7D]|uniref:aldehyde dehydrogenase family protein n=1 Tax=unclassified Methyloligella TaxID=2625955 RepID=UPI00157CA429|nr:aldehyde dehydrogenase family protein [Methyloligella sp. GL2]QKP76671.1 aldehyde dehydrogenase family protein [Methyloligella sp. GL2]